MAYIQGFLFFFFVYNNYVQVGLLVNLLCIYATYMTFNNCCLFVQHFSSSLGIHDCFLRCVNTSRTMTLLNLINDTYFKIHNDYYHLSDLDLGGYVLYITQHFSACHVYIKDYKPISPDVY